jgi:hypothetical protein
MTAPSDKTRTLFGETAQDAHEFDVWLMARRAAMLYHYLAQAIVARLGPEEGHKVVKDAVWQYGEHCGRAVREQVEGRGDPLTAANFRTVPDLPSRGWRSEVVDLPDGTKQHRTVLCPLARTWRDIGTDPRLARLYCWVDQSKIHGYNADDLLCYHRHNVLDGDGFCEIIIEPRRDEEAQQ